MSFSHKVKDELVTVVPGARHCQIAEIAAIISMNGYIYRLSRKTLYQDTVRKDGCGK